MKSVVLCGSRRYTKEIRAFAKKLRSTGAVVFEPFLNKDRGIDKLKPNFKKFVFIGLTLHQFEYIRKADIVFIFNKDGYMGNSTTLELGAAVALAKPIYALEHDSEEPCRDVLIDEIIKTPQALIKKLK